MTVYHGGAEAIPHPDLAHSRRAVDFGAGFYVTPIYEQAKQWCEKRHRRSQQAVVSTYAYNEQAAEKLNVLIFDSYSEAWLDFIVACRLEQDVSTWDIVIGGIANDRVFDTLEAFFDGFASREQTIAKLKYEQPNVQMCFRTVAALETLTFEGSKRL